VRVDVGLRGLALELGGDIGGYELGHEELAVDDSEGDGSWEESTRRLLS
jgi:hypothetical protein